MKDAGSFGFVSYMSWAPVVLRAAGPGPKSRILGGLRGNRQAGKEAEGRGHMKIAPMMSIPCRPVGRAGRVPVRTEGVSRTRSSKPSTQEIR